MHNKQPFQDLLSHMITRAGMFALAMAIVFALTVVLSQTAQAQTYKVIYNFTGGQDGGNPLAGLTLDKAGNLYGTATAYGAGYGTVFELKHSGSSWIFNPLYSFAGGSDGDSPRARVIFGPSGSLYGTTLAGGVEGHVRCVNGCGTVFNLRPSPKACTSALCPWTETQLYRFTGVGDGSGPIYGDLIFDQAGNIYGTTAYGGSDSGSVCYFSGCGTVYKMTPSGGGWTKNTLYTFSGDDGANPYNGVIFDNAGNLYGTTVAGGNLACNGGYGCGTVFQLTYSAGSGWTENVLYSFQGGTDGRGPNAGLISDRSGNLYGATGDFGQGNGGTVFELTPSGSGWTYTLIYSFTGCYECNCGPQDSLVMDGAGNLYGTTRCDGAYGQGSVFKLTPSGGGWTYTSLYDFPTGILDGAQPYGSPVLDANGNLYGTAALGGAYGPGVVWEITP